MAGRQGKDLRAASQNEKNILTQRQGCHHFDACPASPYTASAFGKTNHSDRRNGHYRKSQRHTR
jgi:hypothetical protein